MTVCFQNCTLVMRRLKATPVPKGLRVTILMIFHFLVLRALVESLILFRNIYFSRFGSSSQFYLSTGLKGCCRYCHVYIDPVSRTLNYDTGCTVILTLVMLALKQTQNICIAFVRCWPNVFDVGPTLYKCHTNVLCLPGPFSRRRVDFQGLLSWIMLLV